ncbi:hypothetical protein AGMMS50267_06730 [Spirochaetia bacterium]|nr:hypothetical protein AGMMS50267_06730 [Spirochaetia bacterium]
MKALKALYTGFCKVEEYLVSTCVALITFLVFLSAVARGLKHPLNWAQDFFPAAVRLGRFSGG